MRLALQKKVIVAYIVKRGEIWYAISTNEIKGDPNQDALPYDS